MSHAEHCHAAVLASARRAAAGDNTLSTGERLAAALVLDRADWLQAAGYTLAEAIERVGPDWLAHVPAAARQLQHELAAVVNAVRDAADRELEASLFGSGASEQHLAATLVTTGSAPGYRTPNLVFDVVPVGSDRRYRIDLHLRAKDGETIVRHIRDVHAFAWRRGTPLDLAPGETRPAWIDR